MICQLCGSECDSKICEGCNYVKNHPEVIRNDLDFVFWLSVEIEAMEMAEEQTLFRCHSEKLKKEIQKKNKKLKNVKKELD